MAPPGRLRRHDRLSVDRLFFVVQNALKYWPFDWCMRLRSVLYRPFFAGVGHRLRVYDGVTIKYPSRIRLGDDVTVNVGCMLVGGADLTIGNGVMIGAGSKIVTSEHVAGRTDTPMHLQGIATMPVTIGDDVWLGFDAKVLAGARLARGCIVAAGAVVTGEMDVPAFSVLGGVPARVLKSRLPTPSSLQG
jgi:acetyltransferase-like isoleucine patch superfamily enzyme